MSQAVLVTALAVMALPATGHAQAAPDSDLRDSSGAQPIIVSGTRIAAPQSALPYPVTAIDAEVIRNSGETNLTDILADYPALTSSYTSEDGAGSIAGLGGVGLNLLNLRNLGTQRTLVLVDGKRHVASVPGSSSVDINTIPVDLVERVDIVTGGTSAIYGADAVAGVVNFVMRRDFEGLRARAQGGVSTHGDAQSYIASLTAGTNFADDRGNLAASFEYGREDSLLLADRAAFRTDSFASFFANPADGSGAADDPAIPDNIPFSNLRYATSSPISAIDLNFDFRPDMLGDGTPFDRGVPAGSAFTSGGSGTPLADYIGDIAPQVDRYIGNLNLTYTLGDGLTFSAQGKYARVDSRSLNQPTYDGFITVSTGNPFVPAGLQSPLANGYAMLGTVMITGRDNFDLGRRAQANQRETWRGALGLEWGVSPDVSFAANYVYGRSRIVTRQQNTRYNDRFFAALDAVDQGQFLTGTPNGNVVCRSDLFGTALVSSQFLTGAFNFAQHPALSFTPGPNSGCVPINPFVNGQSAAAVDWIMTDTTDRSTITQHVASATLSGNLGENLALWGGPVRFAAGAEYRKEKSASTPDPLNATGLTFANRLLPSGGSFDVFEGFAELRVPVIADQPGFHDLTVSGALRVSDYSTIGTNWTFQTGLTYAPIPDLRFRGTYAQAVRSPNIDELFAPSNASFAVVQDPCAISAIGSGSPFRTANCATLLGELGLSESQIASFNPPSGTNVPGLNRGNANLDEEKARTLTVGVVLQPQDLPGLLFSADFYDVRIRGAVNRPGASTIAALCVDAETLNNPYCDAITRAPAGTTFDPARAGSITSFVLFPSNVSIFRTKGIDFALRYTLPTQNAGSFAFNLVGNYLDTLVTQATPSSDPVRLDGVIGAPQWQATADLVWNYDAFTINYGINFFSKTRRYTQAITRVNPDIVAPQYRKIDARLTHDLQLRRTTRRGIGF
ncbi:MAG: TonB-dependent receptor plug domain-containing protein, partial [Novosphingobium sp.]